MKISRILSIVMLLLQNKKITANELATIFEVSTRTIYRDIDTIGEAGIPIATQKGSDGGIWIMEEYKIEKVLFSISDVSSVLTALINLPLSSKEIINTMVKIKGLMPIEHTQEIELKSNQLVVDYTPWYIPNQTQNKVEEIKKALRENYYLFFHYTDKSTKETIRKVEPYRLILKNSTWYLQAYCTSRSELRTFRISRTSKLQILDEKFIPRELKLEIPSDPYESERRMTIKLLVDKSLQGWMIDFCGEKNVRPHENNKLIVNFPFVNTDYGYSFLLRFGDKCECIEPREVRLELMNRINNLSKLYQ